MRRLQSVALALYIGVPALCPAPAQSPPKRELTVVVLNSNADPAKPVQGASVSLTYVSGSDKVTGARDATSRGGEALLLIAPEALQSDDLRIEITGAGDLVVYQPADGQLMGLPQAVTVKLLPKGSFLLLGPTQLKALLHRLSLQNNAKSQEIHALKEELAASKDQKPDDLTAALSDWAKANGFELGEVDKQLHQWADDVEHRQKEATAEDKALAEFALKHFDVAASMFHEVATDQLSVFKQRQQRQRAAEEKEFQAYVDSEYQSADSSRLATRFHDATKTLEEVRDEAADQHRLSPQATAIRDIWLDALGRAADARVDEAVVGESKDIAPLFKQSFADYQSLLHEYSSPDDREKWARTQNALGAALTDQAERTSGTQATTSVAQAVDAFRAALQVYTKTATPQGWAKTQNNLGNALTDQGMWSSGVKTTDLLAQAVQAYRAALEVETKAAMPQDWAKTEDNLGVALWRHGERNSGAQSMEMLTQAAEAYRKALEVESLAATPQDWGMTQNNLGIVLTDQGVRSSGTQATGFLAQSVEAYNQALHAFTKPNLPQDWAMAQSNLGVVLRIQGERSSGAQSTELLAGAVHAFRSALEVRTRPHLPQDWARTENHLCLALLRQAERSDAAAAMDLLAQSIQACHASLEVRTQTDLPQAWAWTQSNLGAAQIDLSERSTGPQAIELFAQAAQTYSSTLDVFTLTDMPQDWSRSQNSLASVYRHQAEWGGGPQAVESLNKAIAASHSALEVLTKTELPQDWADAEDGLGNALVDLGESTSGPGKTGLFNQAAQAFRAALEVQTQADLPYNWARTQSHLARVLADGGDISAASAIVDSTVVAIPADFNVLRRAVFIDHDKLFQYDRSHDLAERWLQLDPSAESRLSVVEQNLTIGRFDECAMQAALIDDAAFPAPAGPMILVRDTMKLACQWAAGQKAAAHQTQMALLQKTAGLGPTGWAFNGTRHYLASSAAFEPARASWIALFESLGNGDGPAMAQALHGLEPVTNP